jgi:hypothetical protein
MMNSRTVNTTVFTNYTTLQVSALSHLQVLPMQVNWHGNMDSYRTYEVFNSLKPGGNYMSQPF